MSLNAGGYRASDLSREMTLRNASENRRLAGHLQHLDLQLQQNLVNMQAEILDLKQSRKGTLVARHQRPKGSFGRTVRNPRQGKDRQNRSGSRLVSPLTIQGNSKEISQPFLPQISTENRALVGKQDFGVETRLNSSNSRAGSRRARELSSDNYLLSSNLYRPKSSPNLNENPERSKDTNRPCPDSSRGTKFRPLEKSYKKLRPNTRLGEQGINEENGLKQTGSDAIPTINIEDQSEPCEWELEANSKAENQGAYENDEGFLSDEELFRNSLLLRADRDDGLSRSMPDLSSLGFMDFNEVIDQRLRKLQEELPSKEEMRKVRYLRFRDEPTPPSLLSVFNKGSVGELDKIDE
ncbi:hypothetical protein AWC38_SpisGene11569 [Stylophora pistillata]|uniref:Uncharacterized protein n=1 Tax=Stylophora pistillata TaxID=50429 RepID=A0A2B4RZH1_STYPI|nr:hypothetical protein AWC38_SpisGene11569 [Stylophora pistillata]